MAKKCLEFTLDTLENLSKENYKQYQKVIKKNDLSNNELATWKLKAQRMLILVDEESKIYEQHEGFFRLPKININDPP